MSPFHQDHHEDPGAAHARALGIKELSGEAEVHLRLGARVRFQPERRARGRRSEAAQEPLHRGVAARELVLVHEQLPDRLPLRRPGPTILTSALDQQPLPALSPAVAPAAPAPLPRHARPWTTFFPDPGAEDRSSASWN
jgi:hypothetical protein